MNNNQNMYSILLKLYIYWEKFEGSTNCAISTTHLDVNNYREKTKKIYDYVLDYDTINTYFKDGDYTCSLTFDNYIKEGFNTYKDIKNGCTDPNDKMYCELIDKIKTLKKDNLTELKCPKVIDDQAYLDKENQRLQGDDLDEIPSPGFSTLQGSSSDTTSSLTVGILFPLFGMFLIILILYKVNIENIKE